MSITEPRAIRALAHPLRLDLIELLGALGDATAAQCARRLGTSQASCSFHLRQLAKYGVVIESERSRDARERPWRLAELEQSWSSEAGTPADKLRSVFVDREARHMLGWTGRRREESAPWRRAAFLGGMTLPLTPSELDRVGAELRAILDRYVARLGKPMEWPQDARLVRLLLSAVPLPQEEMKPTGDVR